MDLFVARCQYIRYVVYAAVYNTGQFASLHSVCVSLSLFCWLTHISFLFSNNNKCTIIRRLRLIHKMKHEQSYRWTYALFWILSERNYKKICLNRQNADFSLFQKYFALLICVNYIFCVDLTTHVNCTVVTMCVTSLLFKGSHKRRSLPITCLTDEICCVGPCHCHISSNVNQTCLHLLRGHFL